MSFDVLSDVNYLAVLVAAVAWWILGAIWYARPVFGRRWAASIGIQLPGGGGQRPGAGLLIGGFLAGLVTTLAVAMVAVSTKTDTVGEGIVLGLVAGVGISAMLLLTGKLYEQKQWAWYWINAFYNVIGLILVGIIIALWP